MIRLIKLFDFKCFDKLSLPLQSLTVLSGTNSSGKSSVIQSLSLLAQTFRHREWSRELMLNGPSVALGTAGDLLNQVTGNKVVGIRIDDDTSKIAWEFSVSDRQSTSAKLTSLKINNTEKTISNSPIRYLVPEIESKQIRALRDIADASWISAERLGPRELLPLSDPELHEHVGAKGEYAAGLLYHFSDRQIPKAMCIENEPPTLFHQVRAQLGRFFPGCDLRLQPVDGASAITLRFRSSPSTDFHRPQNVGFGITQLFPILVAVLAARDNSILMIENPEVHLHPAAQQALGQFLAEASRHSRQIIIETHSDHILNGVRLAVKEGLSCQAVALHFFRSGQPVASPTLDDNGRISEWPEGFFDQFDHALSRLI